MTTAARVNALVTRLKTITAFGTNVFDGVPNSIYPPAAWVRPMSQQALSMDLGTKTHTFQVVVAVGQSELLSAQQAIYEFVSEEGDSSVEAAILADESIGVMNVSLLQIETQKVSDYEYVTARWEVEML